MTRVSIACLLAAGLALPALVAGAAAAQEGAPVPRKPANLCQELVAFVKQPEPAKQAAATPPQQATAVSNPSGKTEGAAASASATGASDAQQKSGLSGPVPTSGPAPAPSPQAAPTQAAPTQAAPTQAAPTQPAAPPASPSRALSPKDALAQANLAAKGPAAPGTPPPPARPDAATIEKAEAAASTNDQTACRAVARAMRMAGVPMPPPLLALTALDPKFHTP